MAETVHVDLSPVMAAISIVENEVGVARQQISRVASQVDVVAQEQENTKKLVESVLEEFRDYVEKDDWTQTVVKAKADLQLVRQEIEKQFGHHDGIRRVTIGILQATDGGSVRKETIHTTAEQGMLHCPRYWLAPALLALSAWITNNREVAEKNVSEAISRDDSKTSLLFALVCRRAQRMEACIQWLRRYFQLQNPMAMGPRGRRHARCAGQRRVRGGGFGCLLQSCG